MTPRVAVDGGTGRGAAVGSRRAFLRAVVIAASTAAIVALVSMVRHGGYGAGDLPAFLLASALFASSIGVAGYLLNRTTGGGGPWWRIPLELLGGALLGVAGVAAAALLLGPMIGAASLPLLAAWVLGGALALTFSQRRLTTGAGTEIGGLALIALVAALLFEPVALRLRGAQEIEVIWLSWSPAPTGLTVVDGGDSVDAQGMELLRDAGVRGQVGVLGRGSYGTGPRATVYVVLKDMLSQRRELRQPDGARAVYLQETGHSFRLYPPTVKTRDELIEMEPASDGEWFQVWVETAVGRSGRGVTWAPVAEIEVSSSSR